MSRLVEPKAVENPDEAEGDDTVVINRITLAITTDKAVAESDWKAAAAQDEQITQATTYATTRWPSKHSQLAEPAAPYWHVRDELHVTGDLLMRGEKLVVPRSLRETIMEQAHEAHNGIQALKRLIRHTYWWPAVDRDIERKVQWCSECASADKTKTVHKTPLQPVPVPPQAWHTIGMDIAGPMRLNNHTPKYAIVAIDYTSRWPEVEIVDQVTTKTVIQFLTDLMQREGPPRKIITDNGVQFTSQEMITFLKQHGIEAATTALYHPQSNGLTERFNRTLKENIQLNLNAGHDWLAGIRTLLWSVRTTPNENTGLTPFQVMRGRNAATKWAPGWQTANATAPVDFQKLQTRMQAAQEQMKHEYDQRHKTRPHQLMQGDWVVIRLPGHTPKGSSRYTRPQQIAQLTDKVATMVDGRTWSADRLVECDPDAWTHKEDPNDDNEDTHASEGAEPAPTDPTPQEVPEGTIENESTSNDMAGDSPGPAAAGSQRGRTRRAPAWWDDYVIEWPQP